MSITSIPIWPAAAFRDVGPGVSTNTVALTPQIEALIASNCVVAIGVSGGKDSDACAIATVRHLDSVGHTGPRVLIHSDLGRVEWLDSLPSCERLAARLGMELMVVRRKAGDMLARWQVRWHNNVERYTDLSCVRLVLPWSTPSLRFCTSELKGAVISSELRKRFPTQDIVSVTGIRREESANRSRMPVSAVDARLVRKGRAGSKGAAGMVWNSVIEWPIQDVLSTIKDAGLQLHEAYTRYGASRVSCAYCIMSSAADMQAASSCPDNQELFLQMVELEVASTFGFQGSRWVADMAPHWVSDELRTRIDDAKARAVRRQAIEARIPAHLMYTSGWPTDVPSQADAQLLAGVRQEIGALMGIAVKHTTADAVRERYSELMALRVAKELRKAGKSSQTSGARVGEAAATDVTDESDADNDEMPLADLACN